MTAGHVLYEGKPAPNSGEPTCSVCGGASTYLPTECPETVLTDDQRFCITAGVLDYRQGFWQKRVNDEWALVVPERAPVVHADEHTTFHVLSKGDASVNIPDRTAEVSVIVEGADAHAVGTFRVWLAGAFAVLWGERACDVSVLTAEECEVIAGPAEGDHEAG